MRCPNKNKFYNHDEQIVDKIAAKTSFPFILGIGINVNKSRFLSSLIVNKTMKICLSLLNKNKKLFSFVMTRSSA